MDMIEQSQKLPFRSHMPNVSTHRHEQVASHSGFSQQHGRQSRPRPIAVSAEEALCHNHIALRYQEEVDGLAQLVDRAVEVFLDAIDLDVRLTQAPTARRPGVCVSGLSSR